jgi:hypothetical protein
MYMWNQIQDFYGESSIQQEEDSVYKLIGLNLRKKIIKGYTLSIVLYVAETWTLRKVDQKNLDNENVVLENEGILVPTVWRSST